MRRRKSDSPQMLRFYLKIKIPKALIYKTLRLLSNGATGGTRTPDPRLRRSSVGFSLRFSCLLSTIYTTFLQSFSPMSTFSTLVLLLLGYKLGYKASRLTLNTLCIFMGRFCICYSYWNTSLRRKNTTFYDFLYRLYDLVIRYKLI